MAFCTGCGHRITEAGRFCTNCGQRIVDDSPDRTAERPALRTTTEPAPSAPPPPAYTPPPAARYPLYADDVRPPPPAPSEAPADGTAPPAPPPPTRGGGPSLLVLALVTVILLLVAVLGGLLMLSGGEDDDAADPRPSTPTAAEQESAPPSRSPRAPADSPPPSAGSQDVARFATVTAPRTARPNLDTRGNLVRYVPSNMTDGVPSTCWRTPGDGTGIEITFEFPEPVELTEVGLINGYAKQAGRLDWYAGNRKVLAVEWTFDDGTEVAQALDRTRDLQTVEVGPVTTTTVRLRLTEVSEPGNGPARRNYTPISDVALVGAAA